MNTATHATSKGQVTSSDVEYQVEVRIVVTSPSYTLQNRRVDEEKYSELTEKLAQEIQKKIAEVVPDLKEYQILTARS